MYEYKATLVRVVDGDTVVLDIDLGFGVWKHGERCRLAGIDAPEIPTSEGYTAADALAHKLTVSGLVAFTKKDSQDKYGRYLVTIFVGGENVNEWMVNNHYAVPYDGKGPRK